MTWHEEATSSQLLSINSFIHSANKRHDPPTSVIINTHLLTSQWVSEWVPSKCFLTQINHISHSLNSSSIYNLNLIFRKEKWVIRWLKRKNRPTIMAILAKIMTTTLICGLLCEMGEMVATRGNRSNKSQTMQDRQARTRGLQLILICKYSHCV